MSTFLPFQSVVILFLVIALLVRPIVEAVEENKLTVLRLFLDMCVSNRLAFSPNELILTYPCFGSTAPFRS